MSQGGFENENQLILALDGQTYEGLTPNLRRLVKVVFPDIDSQTRIVCKKKGGAVKADLELTYRGKSSGLSVKNGSGNSVHQEPVEKFIEFLKQNFDDDKTVFDCIRHFIWGDGTLDGSAEKSKRIDARRYVKSHNENLEIIKKYFDKHKRDLILRFVLLGDKGTNMADFIYYGDVGEGYCVEGSKVLDYLTDPSNESKSAVPLGPLTFQAWNRAIKESSVSEGKRGVIQLKWPDIKAVLKALSSE